MEKTGSRLLWRQIENGCYIAKRGQNKEKEPFPSENIFIEKT
jgi:hypothetical protein